jgi:hypothetical protein
MVEAKILSRRNFLRQTLLGSASLTVARFVPSFSARFVPSDLKSPLLYFSEHEFVVIKAVADRIIGDGSPSASDVDAALRADAFLAGADPEVQDQFHQLLTVFNNPVFTFLWDFRFGSFVNMSDADKDSYLEDWMTSVFGFRRTGFQALKRVCMSVYYTEPHSWQSIDFDDSFVPAK